MQSDTLFSHTDAVCKIAAGSTEVAEAIAHNKGSGSIELKASNKLKASIAGSGNIYYLGNPTKAKSPVIL